MLNRLNGMFGLAIWDVRQRRLVLARDPFGIKLISMVKESVVAASYGTGSDFDAFIHFYLLR